MDEEEDSQVPSFGSKLISASLQEIANDFPGGIITENNFMFEVPDDLFEREEEEQKEDSEEQQITALPPAKAEPKIDS